MKKKVSIIILNWNGWKDTIECLESLYQIDYPYFNVVVVDNASADESILKIKEYCEGKIKFKSDFFEYSKENKPIELIEYSKEETESLPDNIETITSNQNKSIILIKNDKNYGFAEGNNIGIRYSMKFLNTDYILLLNNDTVVDKDFLKKLVYFASNDKRIGLIGPKIYYYDNPKVINSAGIDIIWHLGSVKSVGYAEIDEGQFNKTSEKDSLMGACILINCDLIKKIGCLDSKFFLLFEEIDFCIRAKKAGYKVVFLPASIIYHKEGFSSELNPISLYYMYRNRLLFIKKHQTPNKLLLYICYLSLRTTIGSLIYALRGDFKSTKSIIKGHLEGLSG